ncbi:hypothetical protein [Crassaminicella profunda]|uniref:hypothetical protein n=1 Tax=Crassaminicella profunda TaxID=1286698 RepID=UPI001CA6319C|nr:hypothetical protein [Crassaminicella profunda]QZY53597.1 hypothetical protein K7H06_11030 [Crassaminicella profunda]
MRKYKIFNIRARENIDVLFNEIASLYDQFNDHKELIKSIAYAKNYYYESSDVGIFAA